MARERHNVAFLIGTMFGAAGAAVAALLYTPLSGAETRQQLGERVAALRGEGGTPTQDTGTVRTTRIVSTDAAELARAQGGDTTVTTTRIYSSDRNDTPETTNTFGA